MKNVRYTAMAAVLIGGGIAVGQVNPGQAKPLQQGLAKKAFGLNNFIQADSCNSKPAVPFTPFTLAQLTTWYNKEFSTNITLTPTTMVTFDGKQMTAKDLLDQVNKLEQALNANGYSLREGRGDPGVYECKNELSPSALAALNTAASKVFGSHIPDTSRHSGSDARNKQPGQTSQAAFPATGQNIPIGNTGSQSSIDSFLASRRTGYKVPGGVVVSGGSGVLKSGGGLSSTQSVVNETRSWDSDVLGRKDILAVEMGASSNVTASSGGTNLSGQVKVDYWTFNVQKNLLTIDAAAGVNGSNTGNASFIVQDGLGNTVQALNQAIPLSKAVSPQLLYTYSDNVSMSFFVGPVLCDLKADWDLRVGYDYKYLVGGGTPNSNGLRPLVAFGQANAYTKAGVNVTHLGPNFLIVRFGFTSDLQIIDNRFTLTSLAKLDFDQNSKPYFGVYADGYDTIKALQSKSGTSANFGAPIVNGGPGVLSAYIEYPHFGKFWHPTWKRSTREIWSWPGVFAQGYIFSFSKEVPY